MKPYRRRLSIIAGIIASGFLVAGCGGGDATDTLAGALESPAGLDSSSQSSTPPTLTTTSIPAQLLTRGTTPQPLPGVDIAPAKPRTALGYLGRPIDTPTDQALVARYQFVIMSLWAGMGESRLQATIKGIKAINPNIKLAQYVIAQEIADLVPGDPNYASWKAINDNDWWLRDAAGNRTQWTPLYKAYLINPTAWTAADDAGARWPQVKAKMDSNLLLGKMKGIDYVYLDGFGEPLADADWKLDGTNQLRTNPEVASAFRKGIASYASELRRLNPGVKIIGNSADVSSAEYSGQIEGVNRECLMGKRWSMETWAGWARMMDSYRSALKHTTGPHDVVFGACSPTADPALYRYGIASALMEDGYFLFSINGYQNLPWFDESDAPLGTAAEAPPKAATSSGIWMRRYTNGVALVNPSKTTALSIDLGSGYMHLKGTIDPVVNNGLAERVVTLPPRSGLIMIKKATGLTSARG